MRPEDLKWKRVDDGFDEIDDIGGDFYGLEEIDDVTVVKDGNRVSFVPKTTSKSKPVPANKSEPSGAAGSHDRESVSDSGDEEFSDDFGDGFSDESEQDENADKPEEESKKNAPPPVEEEEDDPGITGFSVLTESERPTSFGSWPTNLNSKIYAGLKHLNFTAPTPIQAQSIPVILNGHDVIGKASTGSGKTLAYSIPLLQRHYAEPVDSRPEGLIISPTRELAHQIRDHLQAIVAIEDKHRIVAVTGGLAIQKQLRQLGKSPAVVVATPGRLLEVLEQMPVKQQQEWQKIPSLVLDEADRLIQSGSFAELESIMKIIGVSRHRQVLVYSATFNPALWSNLASTKKRKRDSSNSDPTGEIRQLMQKKIGLNETATFIDADPRSGEVADSVLQAIIECPNMEKDLYLYYFLLLYPGKSIVFVNSIDAVKRIMPLLKELNIPAFGVHSDMVQKQRLRSIERFRNTPKSVLVATDVAARGLDVPAVDHVLHYHLPRTGDMYVHRSGRTARAGNDGVSVVLCSPQEASGPLPKLVKLISSKPVQIDVDYDMLERLRGRVQLAKKIADAQSVSAKKGKSDAWLSEAANELGVDIDDDIVSGGDLRTKRARNQEEALNADLRGMRAELAALMAQKLTANRRYLTSGTRNLAHEMLKGATAGRSALEELAPKKRKRADAQRNKQPTTGSETGSDNKLDNQEVHTQKPETPSKPTGAAGTPSVPKIPKKRQQSKKAQKNAAAKRKHAEKA